MLELAGQEVPAPKPWRAALEPDALALIVLDDGRASARFELAGRSRLEAFNWLTAQARDRGTAAGLLRLDAPYTIPTHAVAFREPFPLVGEAPFEEVSRWISDADAVLRAVAEGWPSASPVRVWPHHFDAGVVQPLANGGAGTELVAAGGGEERATRASDFLSRTIGALRDHRARSS